MSLRAPQPVAREKRANRLPRVLTVGTQNENGTSPRPGAPPPPPPIELPALPDGVYWPSDPFVGWGESVIIESWKLIGALSDRSDRSELAADAHHNIFSFTKAFRVSPGLRRAFGFPMPRAGLTLETSDTRSNRNFLLGLFAYSADTQGRVYFTKFKELMSSVDRYSILPLFDSKYHPSLLG